MRRRHAAGYAFALFAVALVSVFIGLVLGHVNLANASMLYFCGSPAMSTFMS